MNKIENKKKNLYCLYVSLLEEKIPLTNFKKLKPKKLDIDVMEIGKDDVLFEIVFYEVASFLLNNQVNFKEENIKDTNLRVDILGDILEKLPQMLLLKYLIEKYNEDEDFNLTIEKVYYIYKICEETESLFSNFFIYDFQDEFEDKLRNSFYETIKAHSQTDISRKVEKYYKTITKYQNKLIGNVDFSDLSNDLNDYYNDKYFEEKKTLSSDTRNIYGSYSLYKDEIYFAKNKTNLLSRILLDYTEKTRYLNEDILTSFKTSLIITTSMQFTIINNFKRINEESYKVFLLNYFIKDTNFARFGITKDSKDELIYNIEKLYNYHSVESVTLKKILIMMLNQLYSRHKNNFGLLLRELVLKLPLIVNEHKLFIISDEKQKNIIANELSLKIYEVFYDFFRGKKDG